MSDCRKKAPCVSGIDTVAEQGLGGEPGPGFPDTDPLQFGLVDVLIHYALTLYSSNCRAYSQVF